jgi:hypothetical protein
VASAVLALAVLVGSGFILMTAVLSLMLYEGKIALPRTKAREALDAQHEARAEAARFQAAQHRHARLEIEDRSYRLALAPSKKEEG